MCSSDLMAVRDEAEAMVERHAAKCVADEEAKQKEVERRKRIRRAAKREAEKAEKKKEGGKGKGKGQEPPPEDVTCSDFVPNMEKFVVPAAAFATELDLPPFEVLLEFVRGSVPAPQTPEEEPLPRPAVSQIVAPPLSRGHAEEAVDGEVPAKKKGIFARATSLTGGKKKSTTE